MCELPGHIRRNRYTLARILGYSRKQAQRIRDNTAAWLVMCSEHNVDLHQLEGYE